MGKEHNGRVRGQGMGPTPTSYYGSSSKGNDGSNEELKREHDKLKEKVQLMESEIEGLRAEKEELRMLKSPCTTFSTFMQKQFPNINFDEILATQPQPDQVMKFIDEVSMGSYVSHAQIC